MHCKMTKGLHYDDKKDLKKLKLRENVKSGNEGCDLEEILLGNNYKHEYVNVADFKNYYSKTGKSYDKEFTEDSDTTN